MNVVKCKDCKYHHVSWDDCKPTHYYGEYWCEWVDTSEDDYCSLGEVKDDRTRKVSVTDR